MRLNPALEDRAEPRDAGRDPDLPDVLFVPEAIPACRGSTTLTAVDASGALTSPIPTPATRKPGRRVVQVEETEIPDMSSSATPQSARPPERRKRTGTRVDSRPEIGATTNASSESGRKITPVFTAE